MVAHPEHQQHPSEEALERYAMGRVGPGEGEPLEEHLLVCESCQARLTETDQYILAMRDAAQMLLTREEEAAAKREKAARGARARMASRGGYRFLWPAGAMAFAALAVAMILPENSRRNLGTEQVYLQVSRGAQDLAATVEAGHRLSVGLSVAEVAASSSYRVDVVTEAGTPVWTAVVPAAKGMVHFEPSGALAAGRYWVRLSLPTEPPVLLREYGLEAR